MLASHGWQPSRCVLLLCQPLALRVSPFSFCAVNSQTGSVCVHPATGPGPHQANRARGLNAPDATGNAPFSSSSQGRGCHPGNRLCAPVVFVRTCIMTSKPDAQGCKLCVLQTEKPWSTCKLPHLSSSVLVSLVASTHFSTSSPTFHAVRPAL